MELNDIYARFRESTGISTDTRSIQPNSIFLALKGESFNGNKFASQAIESGASHAIVDEEDGILGEQYILVEDCLKTLQQLANLHRRHFDIPVIGLTGSNGKTTTKELIREVLAKKFNVLATKGNLNNHIGVPLTLLDLNEAHEIAIIEMGANHLGEIATLSNIAEPTHGLITNIGQAHIGTFGGFENIIRGKSELFDYLIKTEGTILVNTEDDVLRNMSKRISSPIFYPDQGDHFVVLDSADPFMSYTDETGRKTATHLIGTYNFINAAAAVAVGQTFEVDPEMIHSAIGTYIPENNRSQIIEKGSNTIILDAYNANPSSMSLALENLSKMNSPKHKVAILGDMYELGDSEVKAHRLIGEQVHDADLQAFYIGELMEVASTTDQNGKAFVRKEELKEYLTTNPIENSIVLIKGSRGIKLEEVVDWLPS